MHGASVQGKLGGVPVLELPTDRPYPAGGLSSAGNSAAVNVPPAVAAALRQLTSACGTTLYTTLLTAWKVGTRRLSRAVPVFLWTAEHPSCMHRPWSSLPSRASPELCGPRACPALAV